ncbi:very short patch repair endonuclease [Thermocrispum municipale]|uniref:very short patch repair endonuclease n=1 Tax=Thermocrispum municipale TaxID=37926 RepID=UPI0024807721|nr:very short patch repair endonuclease [Thermocrispum municipale]
MNGPSWASTPATRKAMQANRSRDTEPELRLRRALHARGLRYRVCTSPIPGIRRKLDVVFRPSKVAVEMRGCFWHGCPAHCRLPTNNAQYWSDKISRNRRRDADTEERLQAAGWVLVVVWEHEDMDAASQMIERLVRQRRLI